MIVKIRRVRKYRAFDTWAWPTNLPSFQQFNLIYGVNGTGKSTLASLLQQARYDTTWTSGLHIDVLASDGTSRAANAAADTIWQDIRVFNKEYVQANLRFDEQAGGEAALLLVLGKKRVEAEAERTRIQKRLGEIATELPQERKDAKKAKTQYESLATNRARLIAQEIGSVGGRYEPRSYNASKVRQVIDGGIEASSASSEISDALSLVQSSSMPAVTPPAKTEFTLASLIERIERALAESAVANVLSDLEDRHRSRWVQDGLGLHHERDSCIFCGGPLTAERRQALEAHFDESLVRLQRDLDSMTGELTSLREVATAAIDSLPRSDDLFEVHRQDYDAAVKLARTQLEQFSDAVKKLGTHVDKKRSSLFKPLSLQVSVGHSELSLAAVGEIIQQHNATAASFRTEREKAAALVENSRIAEVADEYRALKTEHANHSAKVGALEDEDKKLRKELAGLDESDLDAEPLAAQLNDDLAHLLGRADLTFEVEGQGYKISRDGTPAQHLSEGERNAISLLYFLRSLETHETEAANSIVVIDDPVSSLDGSMLVGASTHLWTRLVGVSKCRQLFLLTHNFELFRLWASHLEHYPKGRDVAITYGVYEMRMGAKAVCDDRYRRVPILLAWPDDPKVQARLRSEYHYLFWRVISALRDCAESPSAESDVEAATVLPNVCRRLLEGFLGFKYPALLGNLHAQIMRASEGTVSEAMRARVLRFAHAYSHNQEADTTLPVARPEAVEMLHVVLEFMEVIDKAHFDAMCEAIGVSSAFLATTRTP
jgi:wobble nucleotide-excising tRNase